MRKFARRLLLTCLAAATLFEIATVVRSDGGIRHVTNTPEHAHSLNPSLSGNGRRIVFESNYDLTGEGGAPQFRAYSSALDGAAPAYTQIGATRAPSAAVSQDGSRVAFASSDDPLGTNPDHNSEIFVHDAAGLRQLTNTRPADPSARTVEGCFRPSVSDDGRLVAFTSNRDLTGRNPDANLEAFVFDLAAAKLEQLTDSAGGTGTSDAKLSGDGSRLALLGDPPAHSNAARALRLFDLRERTAQLVSADLAKLSFGTGRAVSDDGLRVIFAAETAENASQVFLYDGRNGLLRQLTKLSSRAAEVPLNPTISGDGSRIAFATRRSVVGGNSDASVELYLYDLPTDTFTRVTDAPSQATAEVVASLDDDGSLVAFNFPRVLSGAVAFPEFANNSEIYTTALPPRTPSAGDLQIVNAASMGREPSADKPFAPGQLAIARGKNLALASVQTRRLPDGSFPRSFGAAVFVNSRAAQLLYVSPTQINFQIPDETEPGEAQIVVRNHDGYESRAAVQITRAAPGVFTEAADGRGAAIVLDAYELTRPPLDPADSLNRVRTLTIFATGVRHAEQVAVTLAGRQLTVEAIVPSPDLPGLDEIHVRLLRSLAGAGAAPLVVTADGRRSNATTLQIVGVRRPARVVLSPPDASVGVGRALRLSASAFDEDGEVIPDAQIVFETGDTNIVSLDAGGVVRGLRSGAATVRARSGDAVASASVRVYPLSLVINEILADPPDGLDGDANRDGQRSASQDEFVEIVNASAEDIDLGGYRLTSRGLAGSDIPRHAFPAGTVLAPGTAAVVFGGAERGTFNPLDPAFGGAQVFTATTGGLSLLNGGGSVALLDPSGAVVERVDYGGDTPLEADRNQSLTRSPDLTGDFVPHLSAPPAPARTFSPGAKIDGAPFDTTAPISRIEITPSDSAVQVGATQQFAARAFDAAGRELSGVIFRWQSSDPAVATVDQGGTARALKAGTTLINASARNVASPPVALRVNPPPPRVVRVEVSPASGAVNRGGTVQFTARAFGSDGEIILDAAFVWSSGDAGIATVEASGLARGVGFGNGSVTATTDDGSGGTVAAFATLDVRVPVIFNEILADVPPDNPETAAVEGDANRDGVRDSADDEFVELFNASDAPVDLSGLRISDSTANRFTFPKGFELGARRALILFGGGSPPAADPAFGGALVLVASSLGLNDGGDTVSLKLPLAGGDALIASRGYGTQGSAPAPADQSLTLDPEADAPQPSSEFVAHLNATSAAARPFSPGTRADGTPFDSPPLTRIEITPDTDTIQIGDSRAFNARAFTGTGADERELTAVSFAWDVSHQAKTRLVLTSASSVTLTALAAGTVTLRARAGSRQALATLTLKPPPPVLTRLELSPRSLSVPAGQIDQFTARAFDQYDQPLPALIAFTTSDIGVAEIGTVTHGAAGDSATASVTARRKGVARITATASAGGRSLSVSADYEVGPAPRTPAPGEVVINEALVAFSASSTQPRADFVELYNRTDQALDISGLVITFRPAGASNTPRAVTLPGAPGSDTLRLRPGAYFLIVNGPQTFGATIGTLDGRPNGFDASAQNFDLNNTTGGIKIELAGLKLDGLAYQGGSTAPAPPFNSFGEGPALVFAGGTTNDLIRSPDGRDTNDNAADFKRNGTTTAVTPKGANP